MEVIKKNLRIMDSTAVALCKENKLPIIIFNFTGRNNLKKIILGERIGTLIN